jgi:hypothetical protein
MRLDINCIKRNSGMLLLSCFCNRSWIKLELKRILRPSSTKWSTSLQVLKLRRLQECSSLPIPSFSRNKSLIPTTEHSKNNRMSGKTSKSQNHRAPLLYRRKHTPEQHNHWQNLTTSQMQIPTLLSHNKNQFHRQKEQVNMVLVVTSWPLQAAKLTLLCQSPLDWWAINNSTYDTYIILFITSNTRCQTDKRVWGLEAQIARFKRWIKPHDLLTCKNVRIEKICIIKKIHDSVQLVNPK